MNRTAKLISFAPRYIKAFSCAVSKVAAVFAAARSAHIAGRNYLVVFNNNRPIAPAKAGSAFHYGIGNIKVLAAGSLFLGNVREPITSTKDGPKAINNLPRWWSSPEKGSRIPTL